VDADVYFGLKAKVERSGPLKKAFAGHSFVYGVFSKSGFTKRLLDAAAQNEGLYLINEAELASPLPARRQC
jgi:hypothetical protein